MKNALILIAAGALLAGCSDGYKGAADDSPASEYGVRDLFTSNGCTVTEFYARNQYRYYTRCQAPAQAASTFWQQPSGKATRPDGVAADGLGLRP